MADLQNTIKGLRCHSEPKFGPDEYFCETCPYDEATCGLDVPNDALSLLKAQEPRVMTLDEVADLKEHQFVWIEISNSDEPVYCLEIVRFRGVLCVNLEITLNAFRDVVIVYTKNYNKEYRFWTSRPTDEQREETPWEK